MDVKIDKICRLCASPVTLGYNVFSKCDGIDFSDLIRKYIYIEISEADILPREICEECRFTIRSFDDFASRCGKTQEELFNSICGDINIVQSAEDIADSIKLEISDENKLKLEDVGYLEFNNEDHFDDDFNIELEDPNVKVLQFRNNRKVVKIPKPKKSLKKKLDKDDDYDPCKVASLSKLKKKEENKRAIGRPLKYDYSIIKYLCHVCKTEYSNWISLEKHVLSQHNCKPQIMCICNQVLVSMKGIRKHFKIHFSKNQNISCGKCDLIFFTDLQRRRHMLSVHADEDFMYACNSCDKKFMNVTLLRKHEQKHLPKEITHIYKCDTCDGSFKSLNQLERHKKYVHNKSEVEKLICDICSKEYYTRGGLTIHIMRHQNDLKFKCPKCPKRFVSHNQMRRHMVRHEGIKYRCTICSLVLNSKETLAAHHVIHEEIFRYKCRYCEKQYKRSGDRKHHENRHLGITPYECPWCDKKFVDNSHLRNHKKSQHPKELREYEAIHGPPQIRYSKNVEEIDPKNIIPMIVKRSSNYGTAVL